MALLKFWPVMDLLGTIERFEGRDNLEYIVAAAWGELRTIDGIDYVLAVTAEKPTQEWMLQRRAELVTAGRREAEVDAMTLAEFVEAIRQPAAGVVIAYQPNDREARIIEMVRASGRRMTKEDAIAEMEERGVRSGVGESLAVLVRAQILNNATDARGKGYGLREWSTGPDQSPD